MAQDQRLLCFPSHHQPQQHFATPILPLCILIPNNPRAKCLRLAGGWKLTPGPELLLKAKGTFWNSSRSTASHLQGTTASSALALGLQPTSWGPFPNG